MSKWREVRISELGKVVAGGTPSTKNTEYWNGDIPWLTPKDLSDYNKRYIKEGERNISEKGLENSSAKLLPKDTLLLTSRAPIGYLAIADNQICTNQGFKNIICDNNIVNVLFLYYYFKTNIEYIKLFASGATFLEISAKELKNIKIKIPDLVTQEKIAQILSNYDELIENNNRRIEILENMAEEIYKEWFVRMRFPGHEEVRFEKGIPEGWELKKIGDFVNIRSGYAFKSKWWQETGIPVIKIKDIVNGTINVNDLSYVAHKYEDLASEFKVNAGDLLIAMTGATIGKIGFVPYYEDMSDMLVNQRVGKFFLEDDSIGMVPYLYFYFKQESPQNIIESISNSSSAQPNISGTNLENMKMLYNNLVIDRFNAKISKNVKLMLKLNKQNQNLIKQRDMLLPRLMNGTIEVK